MMTANELQDQDGLSCDPPPTSPFEFVAERGLLRLRRYTPDTPLRGQPPVLFVYPIIKRPFIVDLLPERSIVRNLLQQGFSLYLTDWLPPGEDDIERGFDEYVNEDLAHAIDRIRELEDAPAVTLIGSCCAGLFCAIYAALNPNAISHLITVAAPFESDPPVSELAAEQIVRTYGNVPAWLVGSTLNARMQSLSQTAHQLARDLGEPEHAQHVLSKPSRLLQAFRPWLQSDIPLTGRIFLEFVRDALPEANLLAGRMRVGGRRVDLTNIDCPVLAIAGKRDELVPPRCSARLTQAVGSSDTSRFDIATGHLGLMLSRAAHQQLWPFVGAWIRRRSAASGMESN